MVDADSACLECYGFGEPPFLASPDARFVYRSASLTHAIAAVLDRIAKGDRVIAVTGDPGVGKTTLCFELRRIATEAAARACRIVDDADVLDVERLREHLLGDDASVDGRPPTVLVGQPHLEESLERAGCDRDAIHRVQLGPLEEPEISEYIERRMWVARGGTATFRESIADDAPDTGRHFVWVPRFSAAAIRRVAVASKGNPRVVNVMCAHALELAAHRRATRIRAHAIGPAAIPFLSLPRLAWCTVGVGLAALAMMPSVNSTISAVRHADTGRTTSPLVRSDESFEAFRRRTLQHAAELAAVPDVNELLRVRDAVLRRGSASSDSPQAFAALLTEIDRITNEARARQLEVDHREMLEYAKQH
jgi:type II secretory pathway predicted ATPase ExeA